MRKNDREGSRAKVKSWCQESCLSLQNDVYKLSDYKKPNCLSINTTALKKDLQWLN